MTESTNYIEQPDTVRISGYDIPAALTLPANSEAKELPSAILLIPGSLFSDVNGDFPTWNSFPHVYAHLARQLSALGHAVYRFAKLGPGTGSVVTDAASAATLRTWDGRERIAGAALTRMRDVLSERGVRAQRTIAAGHSEGSVVVSMLAVSERGKELDGVVLLAGPSVGILEIMREQSGQFVAESERAEAVRVLDEVIGYVRRGERPPAELASGGPMSGATALVNMPDEALRYMREVDATDPVELARAMKQHVLVVQGGNDTSVPTHHGERLRDALRSRATGEAMTSYLFVPEVQHMFKVLPPGVTGQEAFGYPGPVDERVVTGVNDWIRNLG